MVVKKEKVSLEKKRQPRTEPVAPAEELPVPEPVSVTIPTPGELQVTKVGSLLKEMRQHKNLKLTDVAKKLCIRRFYLEAIEESRYQDIPEFPYGIGFIRSYADYLGLNSGNIVELYKEETEAKPDKDIHMLEPQTEATVPGKKYLLISLLAVALVYVLWSLYLNRLVVTDEADEPLETVVVTEADHAEPLVVEDYSINVETPVLPEAEPLPVAEVVAVEPAPSNVVMTNQAFPGLPEPAEVEAVTPEPAAPAPEENQVKEQAPAPAADSGIVIRIKGETWVEVKDSQHLYLSKVLKSGDRYVLPNGGRDMQLSVGRPEAAEVLVNGVVTPVATPARKTNISLNRYLDAAANH